MPYSHDTYDRRIQLGASRRRREDAEQLHDMQRSAGAIYLGGYAVECSMLALICYNEGVNSIKDTRLFKQSNSGATLHSLTILLDSLPAIKRAISLDQTGRYKEAWNTITRLWKKDALRYWDKTGDNHECERFIRAIKVIHDFILSQQGEAS